jgi:hypothetical protein
LSDLAKNGGFDINIDRQEMSAIICIPEVTEFGVLLLNRRKNRQRILAITISRNNGMPKRTGNLETAFSAGQHMQGNVLDFKTDHVHDRNDNPAILTTSP